MVTGARRSRHSGPGGFQSFSNGSVYAGRAGCRPPAPRGGGGALRPGRPRAGGDRGQVPRPFESRESTMTKPVQVLDRVTIRFAGDSGDGMQLTGDRFTSQTAAVGTGLSRR